MIKAHKLLRITISFVLLGYCSSFSQTRPITQLQNTNISTGHQLYKQAKINDKKKSGLDPSKIADRAMDRLYYELDHTCNPNTREIPQGIREREINFVKREKSLAFNSARAKNSGSDWVSKGPFNVGGRTRALAIDLTDENVILAGGVSGGMWRSENGGRNWQRTTRSFQHPSVTAIVQDPRLGFQHIWYYGSGERPLGNSASATGAPFFGSGIYKSQDGGRTWELLPATADGNNTEFSPFDIVNSMVVDPTNGDLYLATFNGIHRSKDGGTTFEVVLASKPGNQTEIAVTRTGRFYAFVDTNRDNPSGTESPITGILTSQDGQNWINISAEEGVYNENSASRAIFAINPSNENEVYIFSAEGKDISSKPKLFRYRKDQSVKWTDLTDKLPEFIEPVQGIDIQSGYNMAIAVHPTNPNIILIGGTNLYRTLDGFATKITPDQNNWIAGYSPKNNISVYPDQHPDQHAISFFPSNPNKVLCANDGGVFVTNDVTANRSFEEPIDWISLNNGYLTTQPYAVSFDPLSEGEETMAGFQDNGTWFSNQVSSIAPWSEELSGDGSYNAFADNGRTRYSSAQRGNIFRVNYDENGAPISTARIQPRGVGGASFINPFILDPIDDNVMYLPIGRTIYRNSDLDELPVNSNNLSTVNWRILSATTVESISDNGRELNTITALDISRYPQPDILYYGTGQGQIYRLDFASLPSSNPVDIFTGKGLPENAFVSSITVDPSNYNRVVVAFSNYEIPSLFYTENGGETWKDISGNLEENNDGSGNGPSVRWATFLGNNNGILAGTSTGIYFTDKLLNENTVWQSESREIGNTVVAQVRSRKDGFTVAGIHGNGVFSKKFNVTPQPENTLFVVNPPKDSLNIPSTTREVSIDISKVFKETNNYPIEIYFENSNKDFANVKHLWAERQLVIKFNKTSLPIPGYEKEGETTIKLFAISNGQRVVTEFKISTAQIPFFEQFDINREINLSTIASVFIPMDDFFGNNFLFEPADDFTIPNDQKWSIERFKLFGARTFVDLSLPISDNEAQLKIYLDDSGKPGEVIYDSKNVELRSNPLNGALDLVLPSSIELGGGTYWFSMVSIDKFLGTNNWGIAFQKLDPNNNGNSTDIQYKEEAENDFYQRVPEFGKWFSFNEVFGANSEDKIQLLFSIFGSIESNNVIKQNVDILSNNDVIVFPNPTESIFTFKLPKDNNQKLSISIIDFSGKVIYKESKVTDSFIWNADKVASGVYFANIRGESTNKTIKLVKQ